MIIKNLLKATAELPAVEMSNNYVGNGYNTIAQPDEKLTVSSNQTIIQSLDNITSLLTSSPQIQAPSSVENTILNDDQINEIMSYLLELQEKYFYDIPLSKDLCKQFVWNIPVDVYNAFKHCIDYECCDMANPIMLFYIFCTESPFEYHDSFMAILHELALHDEATKTYIDESHNWYYEEFKHEYDHNDDECDSDLFEENDNNETEKDSEKDSE